MALFELNIYGDNDEIIKSYKTDKVRWGVYLEAEKLNEQLQGAKKSEQISKTSAIVKKIFPGLTDEELVKADGDDVMNTFHQLVNKVNGLEPGNEEKNG